MYRFLLGAILNWGWAVGASSEYCVDLSTHALLADSKKEIIEKTLRSQIQAVSPSDPIKLIQEYAADEVLEISTNQLYAPSLSGGSLYFAVSVIWDGKIVALQPDRQLLEMQVLGAQRARVLEIRRIKDELWIHHLNDMISIVDENSLKLKEVKAFSEGFFDHSKIKEDPQLATWLTHFSTYFTRQSHPVVYHQANDGLSYAFFNDFWQLNNNEKRCIPTFLLNVYGDKGCESYGEALIFKHFPELKQAKSWESHLWLTQDHLLLGAQVDKNEKIQGLTYFSLFHRQNFSELSQPIWRFSTNQYRLLDVKFPETSPSVFFFNSQDSRIDAFDKKTLKLINQFCFRELIERLHKYEIFSWDETSGQLLLGFSRENEGQYFIWQP